MGVRDNFSERDRHLGSLTLGLLTRNQVFESADSKSLRIYMYRAAFAAKIAAQIGIVE